MLKDVSVIIPISPSRGSRRKVFEWIRSFYENVFEEVEICFGEMNEKPFSKAVAINRGVRKSTRDILVIADGDIFYDPHLLIKATSLLKTNTWIIPYQKVMNLTQESTLDLLKIEPKWPLNLNQIEVVERPRLCWGGLNVIPRQHFETVSGFDERLKGWGGEDDAFTLSVNALCGKVSRLNERIYHLWHPPAPRLHYRENWEIVKRYFQGKEAIEQEIIKRQLDKK